MNEEKKIAGAILDAQKMREASYQPDWIDGQIEGVKINTGFGEYKLTIEECLIATCKQRGLSPNLWALLNLGMHWWNDIQLWAEDVFAGKNILEEAEKEKAKMKDNLKCIEKSVDEIVDNDEALSAELAEMEVVLRKEREAENTDSGGNLLDSHRR